MAPRFRMEYRAPEIYDLELTHYAEDVPFYRELARKAGGAVLELGCGTGRLAIPLALAGARMTGLDRSKTMLALARAKARAAGARVRWVRGDMSRFRLGRRFSACFMALNTVQHLLTQRRLLATLRCAHRHLKPRGVLALDVYNPNLARLNLKRAYPAYGYQDPRGRVEVWVRNSPGKGHINRVWFQHRLGKRVVFEQRMRLRCYFPGVLDQALEEAGFRVVQKHGGFDKRPFSNASPLQIFMARRERPPA